MEDCHINPPPDYWDDEPEEDPENEYPMVVCRRCHDYPCRCIRDEDLEDISCPF